MSRHRRSRPLLLMLLLGAACVRVPATPLIDDVESEVALLQLDGRHRDAVRRAREVLVYPQGLSSDSEARLHFAIVDSLLALNFPAEAAKEARRGLALAPETSRDADLYEGLVRLDDGHDQEAFAALFRAAQKGRLGVTALARAPWLSPIRRDSRYPSLVGALLLAHRGLSEVQRAELNAGGGIELVPFSNPPARGTCSLAIVEFLGGNKGELLEPVIEQTGFAVYEQLNALVVEPSASAPTPGIFWGHALLTSRGYRLRNVPDPGGEPRPTYAVSLKPTGLTAAFGGEPGRALTPGAPVALFTCEQHGEHQLVAHVPFEAGELEVRKAVRTF